ncbi:argininosuccinate lyase [Paracoccaceae bacterium GXU_MW_L88]
MIRSLILLGAFALSACVGEPRPPEPAPEPGISLRASAAIGVSRTSCDPSCPEFLKLDDD